MTYTYIYSCQRRWMIGRFGERGSGISVLAAWHHDDDDIYIYNWECVCECVCVCVCILIHIFILSSRLGCRTHWLLLCRGVRPSLNECPRHDTKQSDGEDPVMLELWGMRSTPSLPSVPGLLWLWVVALDRVLSMGQIELNCVLMLNWIVWKKTVLTFNCL